MNLKFILGMPVLAAGVASTASSDSGHAAPYLPAKEACSKKSDASTAMKEALDAALSAQQSFVGRIIIHHCGEVIYDRVEGLADRVTGQTITRDTVFDFGSLTKQFTAAAILKLREQGKLALDDRLDAYFKDLPDPIAGITLHQMLTHSAGLPTYSGDDDYERVSRETIIERLRGAKLSFEPGQGADYSNFGYTLLGMIVEDLSGVSYERYLRSAFFDPLGIQEIGYRWTRGPLVVNYQGDGKPGGTPVEGAWAPDGPYWNLRGNGGILANPADFLRWVTALRQGEALSKDSLRLMFKDYVKLGANGESYGYGWRIGNTPSGPSFNHGGSNGTTFYSHARYAPAHDMTLVFSISQFDVATIRAIIRAFVANS